jgi:hypothetical protein
MPAFVRKALTKLGLWLQRRYGPQREFPFEWHERAIELAVLGSERSAKKYADAANDIVRDAMFNLSRDAVIAHRAIGDLVIRGWSGIAAALLRTLMDIQISMIAIAKSADPKLAAFRYFYSSYRAFSRDHRLFDPESRRSMRQTIRDRITSLPERDRPAALEFLKERDRSYWYSAEFGSPSTVLERFATPDLLRTYRELSGAAHGGFFGVRLFSDDPDDRGINAQVPPGLKAISVALASTRFLVEVTSIRNEIEGLDLKKLCADFRLLISKIGEQLSVDGQTMPASGSGTT